MNEMKVMWCVARIICGNVDGVGKPVQGRKEVRVLFPLQSYTVVGSSWRARDTFTTLTRFHASTLAINQ